MAGHLSFLSSVRRGLAVGIERPDVTDPAAPAQANTAVQIALRFNANEDAIAPLTLVGPGDIVGLDARTVVRTFPRADDNDAQVGYFAMVEFDQPDLPWRYTPAASVGSVGASTDRLRPWINLILLVEGDELTEDMIVPSGADRKLPVLTVAARLLPELAESWAFAHTQVKGTPPAGGFRGSDLSAPGAAVARLLAPRTLRPQTAYRALLVPTFERGRLAGTGTRPGPEIDALALAWSKADPEARISLPIYYQWRFQTGTTGTFEDLAMALRPKADLGPDIGSRQLDVSDPGLNLDAASADPVHLGGALQSLAARALPQPTLSQGWLSGLKAFIDEPKLAFEQAGVFRVVAPPLYGRWYAADDKLDPPPPATPRTNPPWFYQLNSDPRHRVAAALGTEVIQRDQEALMESAWEQARSLVLINEQRSWLQLGRAVWQRLLTRHIGVGLVETVLGVTGYLHGRVLRGGTTVFAQVRNSALGTTLFEPAWRRLTSPQGAIGRRLQLHLLPVGQPLDLFDRMNDGRFQPAPAPATPRAMPTPAEVFDPVIPGGLEDRQIEALASRLSKEALNFWGQVLFWSARQALIAENGKFFWLAHKLLRLALALVRLAADPQRKNEILLEKLRRDTLTGPELAQGPGAPNFVVVDELPDPTGADPLPPPPAPPGSGADSAEAVLYRQGLVKLLDRLNLPVKELTPFEPLDLEATRLDVLGTIDPEKTFVAAVKARHLRLDPGFAWEAVDLLQPFQAAPVFPQPMYLPLRDISADWILPGVGRLDPNTVSAVVTNQRFVEAYMVGLNHEMTRELLWREYPVDQRSTYFQQFWDVRGWVNGSNAPSPPDLRDIKEVRRWGGTELGQNTARPATLPADFLVLLVRGDLIKRYPNVIVYAAKARPPGADRLPDDSRQEFPILHGFLGEDVAFYGFPFTPADARGETDGAGWYVVLQEQPAEPRFNVPALAPERAIVTVADLEAGEPDFQATAAGKIAARKFAVPVRVAIHGNEFIPPSA